MVEFMLNFVFFVEILEVVGEDVGFFKKVLKKVEVKVKKGMDYYILINFLYI